MQRIFRDTWSWRGALALDELEYEPRLVDATHGPIDEPAVRHWPLLSSATELVTVLHGRSPATELSLGVSIAHFLLVERTGGYHAILPRSVPERARRHAAISAGHDVAPLEASLEALEEIGAIERTLGRLALVRPPAPDREALRAARIRMDEAEQRPELAPLTRRIQRLSWEVGTDGIAGRRFRELSRHGRLRARLLAPDPAFRDPDGVYAVGPMALPPLALALSPDGAGLNSLRGWVTAHGLEHEQPPAAGDPVGLAAFEVAALLLGGGIGTNALRRAKRGAALWLALLRHTDGRVGSFDSSTAAIAGELAELLNLAPDGDHRSTVAALLGDLERVGLVATERPARKVLRIHLRAVAAPEDERVRHFERQWFAWRMGSPVDPTAAYPALMALGQEHLRDRVRGGWIAALEQRRVRVRVLPGAGAA
jgi:hypothetical protein